jgi:hypothetical protein
VPQVAVGEDEFVELDEAGQPRKKSARRQQQRPAATVRKKAPSRRQRPPVKLPAAAGAEVAPGAEEVAADFEDDEPDLASLAIPIPEAGPGVPATAPRRPSGGGRAGGAGGRGGGGGRRRSDGA